MTEKAQLIVGLRASRSQLGSKSPKDVRENTKIKKFQQETNPIYSFPL